MKTSEVACLVLLSLALEAAGKDPCSKDWLRFMVVNSCGMDKRHLDRRKPSVAPSLKQILDEVDQEFDNYWRLGGVHAEADDEDEFVDEEEDAEDNYLTHHDGDRATKVDKGILRLFQHPLQLLTEAWMGLVSTESKRKPHRRAIQNAISRCCSENCDEDAFEGVCD